MQSTASMITRPGTVDVEDTPPTLVLPSAESVAIRSADTTRRRLSPIVTLNFSGPRSGTGLPDLSMTWTSTAMTSTETLIRPGRGLLGLLWRRLRERSPSTPGRRRARRRAGSGIPSAWIVMVTQPFFSFLPRSRNGKPRRRGPGARQGGRATVGRGRRGSRRNGPSSSRCQGRLRSARRGRRSPSWRRACRARPTCATRCRRTSSRAPSTPAFPRWS